MSGALYSWYSLPDLLALAGRGAVLEGKIPLQKFERLEGLLNSSDGEAVARIEFRERHDDLLLMELQCAASLELTCQRCLGTVQHEVDERVEIALVETEDALSVVPEGMEPVVLGGDRFQPAELIEDELIVSLPLVPMHGDDQP